MTLMNHAGATSLLVSIMLAFSLQSGSCRKAQEPGAPAAKASPASSSASAKEAPAVSPRPNDSSRKRSTVLREGLWGGQHISLKVTATGAAVELDCAHGEIGPRIELNADGRFEVMGTFIPEGGPVSVPVDGAAQQKKPSARYRGLVEGQTMTLTVTLTDTGNTLDDFTLVYGKAPRLEKCY